MEEQVLWSPTEAIGSAWEKVKADPAGLILPVFLVGLIQGIPNGVIGGIANVLEQNDLPWVGVGLRGFGQLVVLVVSAFLTPGMLTLMLKAVRGEAYALGDVFSGGRFFVPMLITLFLFQLSMVVGFALCIVPGVIIALGLGFAPVLVVDQQLAPIDAFKESWRITTGHKLNLFVFGLLGFVVTLVGLCVCCIGVVASAAIVGVAQVFIYEKLRMGGMMQAPPAPTAF